MEANVEDDVCNLKVYEEQDFIEKTVIKCPNTGGYLVLKWYIECNDKNFKGKIEIS